MKNKFIRRSKLNKWNIITISCYVLLSFFLFSYGALNKSNQKDILLFYGIFTQLFLYSFQYRALRNFNYFLVWTVIGVIHYCFFLFLKDLPSLVFDRNNFRAALILRNTLVTLLLFQFLRFVSLQIQNKELIMPAKNGIDLYDERKVTILDIICFFVFLGVTVFTFSTK
ncbi:hypothetical protein HNP37_003145 [Flavobacterium nitrogenifigens]|uniref:Uncharacterized protein n=2 Tax=Flavobacterium TaxID=237 RepID=A0A7W7J026_9FLAO|nr:hypothetical protein [Flavobacterium nitrogenifigens]MBB6388028.1 hypothetical protein [Flavobacterium notoginsengisoli]